MNHDTHIDIPDALKAVESDTAGLIPFKSETDADHDEVRREMERILASPQFKTTTRAPAFLRQIVDCTLSGRTEQLKERILGIEVFGRPADYDTSLDPVVRVTASRIRQRIAKYYSDSAPAAIRIQLPPGSYNVEFWVPATQVEAFPATAPSPVQLSLTTLASSATPTAARFDIKHPLRLAFIALALTAVLAGGVWATRNWRKNELQRFWAPVMASNGAITLCVGRGFTAPVADGPDQPMTIVTQRRQDYVNWADAIALARVSDMLVSRGKSTLLRQEGTTSLTDLRSGPAVLIGAFNNDWALRLTPELRFRFDRDRSISTLWIVDSQNPTKRAWKLVYSNPHVASREDYGVITRILDPVTERTVVILGGLSSQATIAASEFLTNSEYMAALSRRAPAGWQDKNLQIVIATTVINGASGPPRILAVHTW